MTQAKSLLHVLHLYSKHFPPEMVAMLHTGPGIEADNPELNARLEVLKEQYLGSRRLRLALPEDDECTWHHSYVDPYDDFLVRPDTGHVKLMIAGVSKQLLSGVVATRGKLND